MEERVLLQDSPTGRLLVGIFVLLAAGGFGWLLMVQQAGPDTYRLVAEFDTLGNVNESTKVKLRGFDIGQVEEVLFRPVPPAGEAHFLVRLAIEEHYPVPVGVVAEIRGSGLVGEASVHLDVSGAGEGVLEAGTHIPGRSDTGMKTLMERAGQAASRLGAAGASISTADLGGKFGSISADVSRIADDMARVSASADSLLLAGRQVVSGVEPGLLSALEHLNQSMARLELTMARTDTLVAATSADVSGSVRALRLVAERLDQVLQRVDTLTLSKQAQLDSTLSNLHAASRSLREVSEHPWRLITGQDKPPDGAEGAP